MAVLGVGDKRIQYIQQGINAKMSGAQIQRSLKGTEYGVRRKDLYDTMRYLKRIDKKASGMKFIGKNRRPSEGMFAKTTVKQHWKYMYGLEGNAIDMETGERVPLWRRVGSNRIRTPREVEEHMKNKVEGIYLRDVDLTVVKGWKQ